MLRRHRFWVLGILGLTAIAGLVSGIPEPPLGKRDAAYYFWYPGQAVSSLIVPPIAEAGRLNSYAQLPVAFFVNVLLYASIGMGVVQGLRRMMERLVKKLGGGVAEEQDGR
jgi:hypothetical protein